MPSTTRRSPPTWRSSATQFGAARVHRSQRLLSQGQPERAKPRRCLPPAANSNAAGRRRSPPTWRSRTASARAADILLVEAESNANSNLYAAEQTAVALGATEISNSWGGGEPSSDSAAFNHPGVVITASSGDDGYLNWFSEERARIRRLPRELAARRRRRRHAAEPQRDDEGVGKRDRVERRRRDAAASLKGAGAGGGGCSVPFSAPSWQQSLPNWSAVGCGSSRAVADVVRRRRPLHRRRRVRLDRNRRQQGLGDDRRHERRLADHRLDVRARRRRARRRLPRAHAVRKRCSSPGSLHDVTAGSNGECLKPFEKTRGTSGCTTAEEAQSCAAQAICLAGSGYDGPTRRRHARTASPRSAVGRPPASSAETGEAPAPVAGAAAARRSGTQRTRRRRSSAGAAAPVTPDRLRARASRAARSSRSTASARSCRRSASPSRSTPPRACA